MKIIIKGRKGFKVNAKTKLYIEEKVSKFEDLVEDPSICEVTLLEKNKGPKRGIDKNVHIKLTVPKIKKSLFAKSRTDNFFASIDIAESQIEEQLVKYKDKKKGSRFPIKYWVSKMMETGAKGPKWLVKKIRRK